METLGRERGQGVMTFLRLSGYLMERDTSDRIYVNKFLTCTTHFLSIFSVAIWISSLHTPFGLTKMIQARKQLPCKQRFLSGMPFSVYESRSRGLSGLFSRSVYAPRDVNKPTTRLWNDANDFENAKSFSRKKPQNSLFNNLIFKKQIHTSCFWPKLNWTRGA